MNIAGWQRISLTEDPGYVACVLFVPGCSLDCYYCHNRWLTALEVPSLVTNKVLKHLKKRAGYIKSVVIRGGEPTLQSGLRHFLEKLKSWGYRVRIHTTGSQPEVLRDLIECHLIDAVVMDIKAPEERFAEICGTSTPYENIESSAELLLATGVEHEFRIIVAPLYSHDDLVSMARALPPDQCLVLQPYWRPVWLDPLDDPQPRARPYDPDCLFETARIIRSFLPRCQVRRETIGPDRRLAKRVEKLLHEETNET